MLRAAAVVLAALAAAAPAAAAEPARSILLPSPYVPLTPAPPLLNTPQPLVETRGVVRPLYFRTRQRVVVGVDANGRVRSVEDVYRLLLNGTADYSLVVGAPLVAVERTPDSAADPGRRRDALLWQGFAPGRRILGARVQLRPAAAAPHLPLAVEVERSGARTVVRLVNRTGAHTTVPHADVVAADAARVLDELRSPAGRTRSREPVVQVRGDVGARTIAVQVPLRVRGRLRAGGAWKTVRADLGARPLVVTLEARGRLEVRLDVAVTGVRGRYPPPGAASWAAAVRAGTAPRALGDVAVRALVEAARARQFGTFLQAPAADPDPQTAYTYRTAAGRGPAVQATAPEDGDGSIQLAVALVLGALAAVALVVAWAHL